jgi:Ser/Thr protein kinase RdoA (MazF antagonist)
MSIADEAAMAAGLWGGRIVRLIKHRENAVFEMALPQSRAALRLHRVGYQSEVAIRSELWWAGALADAGVAVPAPQPALSGDVLVTLANGRHCSAISWVEGQALGEAGVPYADDVETQVARHQALGALMAQVHTATARLTLPDWFTRVRWDVDGLTGDNPFWGRFWDHPALTAPEAAALLAARDYLRDWLLALPQPDIGPIHADVMRENVMVDGNRLSLIDFDDSGIGYRLYDLGTTMSQNLYEPHYIAIRDALIAGYGRASMAEVEHFTLARTLVSVGWSAPRVPLGDPVHRRHIDRALHWSRHVMRG